MKIGFHAGVFTKISLSKSLAIQPELLFSTKGIKLNYDESITVDGESKYNLSYIDLPVKLIFNLTDEFEIHFGPYVSYLVFANTKTDAEVLNYFQIDSKEEIDRDLFNSIDYGWSAGLAFDLNPIVVGLSYNLGLKQVPKEDKAAYDFLGNSKNSVIQVSAGIKF